MTEEEQNRVYNADIDFRKGAWVNLYMTDISSIRKQVDAKVASLNVARASCRRLGEMLAAAQERAGAITEAQELAQAVAQAVQQQAHDQIAEVVSRCLEAVFDEPYQFVIHFERKRGRTEASLAFQRNGAEVDPMTASGGGVVDVAAFALRLSCLVLANPPLRRVLLLDEPFKFLSEEYRSRIRDLMLTLSREMGVQFIIVTHMEQLVAGTVVEIAS